MDVDACCLMDLMGDQMLANRNIYAIYVFYMRYSYIYIGTFAL